MAWALTGRGLGPQFACTVIAILLHFLYLCAFAWALLEALHLYRALTEVRDVNAGPMRFYYMLGWGVPAFITGTPAPSPGLEVYIPRASVHLYATFSHVHPRPGGPTSLCPGPSFPQESLSFNSVLGSPTQGEGPLGWRGWHGQRVDSTLPPLHLALRAHLTDSQVP